MPLNVSPTLVPSAHASRLALRLHRLRHPEWRLADDDEACWTQFKGRALDLAYGDLTLVSTVAVAPFFGRLTVLCLRETRLVDIKPLRFGSLLVYLDLSSNEIVSLVDGAFWSSFPDLLILLLHGNKDMEWDTAGSLDEAPRLTYLTLFFNPICKLKMYRTFLANRCESLRGLDMHAVSDEEIIQGLRFPSESPYGTCCSALALPQALFRGLTQMSFSRWRAQQSDTDIRCAQGVFSGVDPAVPKDVSAIDDEDVLASVLRRVSLLRKFHARNSPVVLCQRRVRQFVRVSVEANAAIKIQAQARKFAIRLHAISNLKALLRNTGELYLVQEMMTPTQLRSLAWFQRRIVGRYRLKVLMTCARTLQRFMGKMKKRFSAFSACIDRAHVGGVVVTSDAAADLLAAVSKAATIATGRHGDGVEAQGRTTISTLASYRLIRRFTYVDVPDWPLVDGDVLTDGVFITRSLGRRYEYDTAHGVRECSPPVDSAGVSPRTLSGVRQHRRGMRRPRRTGLFGHPRVRECRLSRRGSSTRRFHKNMPPKSKSKPSATAQDADNKLWVYRPRESHMLARVLYILRERSPGKGPTPYILERHLSRCAAATRLQAAWRGHVLRWNVLDILASCLIVSRAGLCIQRWWRTACGLGARLRLGRRLWALAWAVTTPVLYMEFDVYFALTRGWHWPDERESIAYSFGDDQRVIQEVVSSWDSPVQLVHSKRAREAQTHSIEGKTQAPENASKGLGMRGLPLWAQHFVVPQRNSSEADRGCVYHRAGALLTEGVGVKKVVWPLAVSPKLASPYTSRCRRFASSHRYPADRLQIGSCTLANVEGEQKPALLTSTMTETSEMCPSSNKENSNVSSSSSSSSEEVILDLGRRYDIEMVELTFSSVKEARARAMLVAVATQERGLAPDRPLAQLMSAEMLQRAAAGDAGQAAAIVETPVEGYRRGDSVEVLMLSLSKGHGGTWFPGIVDRAAAVRSLHEVTLDNGQVETEVPESRLRPYDRSGRERAVVEMSHLPSRWQHRDRHCLTPASRLAMELLRRSLVSTVAAPVAARAPIRFAEYMPQRKSEHITLDCGDQAHDTNASPTDGRVRLGRESERASSRRNENGTPSRTTHWPGSSTSASNGAAAKKLAAGALDKVVQAAAAADRAASATTWVPGNRFKRDLEKLVHLSTHEVQAESEEKRQRLRLDAVQKARCAEHATPTPADRLGRLKAAEVAVFRREEDERKNQRALHAAMHTAERVSNVADAKEQMDEARAQTQLHMASLLAKQVASNKQQEVEREHERYARRDRRQQEVQLAKARVKRWRNLLAGQSSRRTECDLFSARASKLTRHMGKHTTLANKTRTTGGMRRFVQGRQMQKGELRRRMLQRVEVLQEQKRSLASRQRKALAARGKARIAMDEAIIRHRLGQPSPECAGDLDAEVMHVLRPSSRTQCEQQETRGARCAREAHRSLSPWGGHPSRADLLSDWNAGHNADGGRAQRRPVSSGIIIERGGISNSDASAAGADERMATMPTSGDDPRTTPVKPSGRRPRSHQQRGRRLQANAPAKTVVVFASVPTASRESRTKLLPGRGSAPGVQSANSFGSSALPRRDEGERADPFVSPLPMANQMAPWPIGRRWW